MDSYTVMTHAVTYVELLSMLLMNPVTMKDILYKISISYYSCVHVFLYNTIYCIIVKLLCTASSVLFNSDVYYE